MKSLAKVNLQIKEIESFLELEDKLDAEVSNWSIYKQLEHILIVNKNISAAILKGKEPEERKARTPLSYFVLTTGFIPRGKAKAPKIAEPKSLSQSELKSLLEEVKNNFSKLDNLNLSLVVANHPYFGGLNSKEWLRFLEVHTNHHLKIVRDIIKG